LANKFDPVEEAEVIVVVVPVPAEPVPGEPVRRGAKIAVASGLGAGMLVDPFVVGVDDEVALLLLDVSVKGRRV